MKTIYCESGLLWTDLLWTRSVMYWTVINVACYESALLWTWSVMNVVCMNVICYERGLLWTWSVTNVACLWIGSDVPESFLSSQSQVRVTIPSSQSRVRVIWNFVESSQSRVMTSSSRVRVESQEWSSHFESLVYKLESMSSHTNFKLFLYIFAYRSANGPSVAVGPPVDLQ